MFCRKKKRKCHKFSLSVITSNFFMACDVRIMGFPLYCIAVANISQYGDFVVVIWTNLFKNNFLIHKGHTLSGKSSSGKSDEIFGKSHVTFPRRSCFLSVRFCTIFLLSFLFVPLSTFLWCFMVYQRRLGVLKNSVRDIQLNCGEERHIFEKFRRGNGTKLKKKS